jgi:hypothetical protein
MKLLFLGLCSALSLIPAAKANTILFSSTDTISFGATATYLVNSTGGGITSQGFSGSAISNDPGPLTLVLDYSALAGSTVLDALLDLSRVLTGNLTVTRTLTSHGSSSVGVEPVFTGAPTGLFASISGSLSGTQTIALSGITSFDLVPFFRKDLEAGKPLTLSLSLGDVFGTSSPAGSSGNVKWKNTDATYALSQTVSGTFTASTHVDFVPLIPPDPVPTPEPLTMALSGAGLIGLGVLRRRRREV